MVIPLLDLSIYKKTPAPDYEPPAYVQPARDNQPVARAIMSRYADYRYNSNCKTANIKYTISREGYTRRREAKGRSPGKLAFRAKGLLYAPASSFDMRATFV